MRLLYYSTSFYASHGGRIQAIEFYDHLEKLEIIEEKAIFPGGAGKEKTEKNFREAIRKVLRKIPLLQMLLFYRRNNFHLKGLEKKIKEFHPDAILIQIDSNFLQIRKIKKTFPEILVCTQINGSPFDEPFKKIAFRDRFLRLQRRAYEMSNLNIFISDVSRRKIMGNAFDPSRDIVIENGTDPHKFFPISDKMELRNKWNFPVKRFILGYVGTLDFHKHLLDLVEAFHDVSQTHSSITLVIVGDGPAFSQIQRRIETLNLEHTIILKGWVDHKYINEIINCFDVAVHHYANSYMNPLKVYEFLAAGLPVVAPNIPSVCEAFQDGKDLLLTGHKKEELKEKLQLIINDGSLRKRLSYNQHLIRNVEKDYTWEHYAERIVNNINKKIANKVE
ncbi:glycosyltransferase family 4 protein [Autumnicola psychrophila]|uniref:Glycosyltransferase family 4 protein n=1 Tax=Autumnicola psychrophila TaxID=3075592 RepID=A0ABU3DSE4_9FLAO|nr:glycosyltransferase family 4 protein [Zunongwangia sp. F225]MDT0686548.1 glycosyltransferase family 4 protein [Zunongwangia sp. F225]